MNTTAATKQEFVQPEYRDMTNDEFSSTLSAEVVKRVERMTDHNISLAERSIEARKILHWNCENMHKSWLEWMELQDKTWKSLAQHSAAVKYESKELLAACGDVRKFFLDPLHAQEMERLEKFVSIVERLKALKADGTLDAIADTILKLAVK